MLRHHLPQVISEAGAAGRYLLSYAHHITRALILALSRLESPRAALRIAHAQRREARRQWNGRGLSGPRGSGPLLIHYHIFKNAGTSFEWALEQALGSGLKRYDKPNQAGFVSAADLVRFVAANPDAQAIASHQAAPPAPFLRGRKVLTSILIRDPIARIRSIYAFERKQISDSRGAVKAKELDFKGYVEWRLEATPRMFCNYQVHFCCREGVANNRPVNRDDLTRAIAALDGVDIVGTVERYEEWLSLAGSVLEESFPRLVLASVRRNQTRTNAVESEAEILEHLINDLGADLAHHLLEQNELDMCLHQVADSLLTRRLAERSISIRLRDTYATVRLAQDPATK